MGTDSASTHVLVTGAGGFIALHTILRLLQLGYNVRATVRTDAQQKNVRETLSKHVDTGKLELVCADLLKEEGWQEAVRGCDFVLHLASPFPAVDPKDENTLFLPARRGTLRVLRAAQAAAVKRVVIVSSVMAVIGGHEKENRIFTESDWTDMAKCSSLYSKSKTLAERAAWEFMRSAENKSGMEMVSVNPSNVLDPVLDDHHHTSTEWFTTLMRREVPGVPRTDLHLVDVRDGAEMILLAMTKPEAAGKSFIVNTRTISVQEFASILQRNFASRGYRVPTRVMRDLLIRATALVMPKLRSVANELGWNFDYSTEQAQSMGWQPRPHEETIVEMAESLIEHKMV